MMWILFSETLRLFGGGLDFVPLAQQDGDAELEMDKFGRGGEDARLGALGENNPFRVVAKLLEDTFDEFHEIKRKGTAGRDATRRGTN